MSKPATNQNLLNKGAAALNTATGATTLPQKPATAAAAMTPKNVVGGKLPNTSVPTALNTTGAKNTV